MRFALRWTKEDDALLAELAEQKISPEVMATRLRRTRHAVMTRLGRLGLSGTRGKPIQGMRPRTEGRYHFSLEEVARLAALPPGADLKPIAEEMGRDVHAVRGKLWRMRNVASTKRGGCLNYREEHAKVMAHRMEEAGQERKQCLLALSSLGPMSLDRLSEVTGLPWVGLKELLDHEWFDLAGQRVYLGSAGYSVLEAMRNDDH